MAEDGWFDNSSGGIGGAVGGAAGSVWDAVNPFSSGGATDKALEQAKAQTAAMKSSAQSGGFRLSPEGLERMQKALDEISMNLTTAWQGLGYLYQEPKLGDHPYGKKAALHDQQSATGDRGAQGVLQQFQQVLKDASEALRIAAKNYRSADDEHSSTFQGNAEA